MPESCTCEDPTLALTLISTWSLLTGRRLRTVKRGELNAEELNAEELLDFWADPQM